MYLGSYLKINYNKKFTNPILKGISKNLDGFRGEKRAALSEDLFCYLEVVGGHQVYFRVDSLDVVKEPLA